MSARLFPGYADSLAFSPGFQWTKFDVQLKSLRVLAVCLKKLCASAVNLKIARRIIYLHIFSRSSYANSL